MLYRTSTRLSNLQAMRFLSNHNSVIVDLQRQISSGERFHRASDDPVAFRQISSLKVQLEQVRAETVSINDTETLLNSSVTALQQTNDLIVRAKSLAQQGVQTTTDSERNALAVEVEGMLKSLKNISRSASAGSFLFGGVNSADEPFHFDGPSVPGGTLTANYVGAQENGVAFIGTRINIETLYVGSEVFAGGDRESMLVFGDTGAQTGVGTDSIVGRAQLEVQHTLTTLAGGSGVIPGASSVSRDTILGPMNSNSISVDDTSGSGDFGTVSLNGGDPIAWTRADQDLQVVDDFGLVVHLDMSAVTPSFQGSVGLQSDGTLSIDGGATRTPIDFSASQTVIDSVNQGQAHFDTREIRKTGTDHLEFPGTSNVFQAFYELAHDLRNSRGFNNVDFAASLDRRIGELNHLSDRILETVGRQSASLQSMSELKDRLSDIELETESDVSELQSTDIPSAVLQMQQHQALLEFTYSVTANIASTNILDFLR